MLVDNKSVEELGGELFGARPWTIGSLNITEDLCLLFGKEGGGNKFVGLCNNKIHNEQ